MDYEKASQYWQEKDRKATKADKEVIHSEIQAFLKQHNTCALATSSEGRIDNTPIEYNWIDETFYFFSEGGKKFLNLKENKNVCLAIFDSYTGFQKIGGMEVFGLADMVEPMSEEYKRILEIKKIPLSAFQHLDHPMYLIKVKPTRIEFLSTEFKKFGVSTRQIIEF